MYRLLIVTTDQATKDMLAAMEGWEALGVKPPRVRETVEDAVECMKKHPIDAIAVEDAPEPLAVDPHAAGKLSDGNASLEARLFHPGGYKVYVIHRPPVRHRSARGAPRRREGAPPS